jgi:hypothetical protein
MKISLLGVFAFLLVTASIEASSLRTQKARSVGRLPDLTVTGIKLDSRCRVRIQVKNLGPGALPDSVWTVRGPDSSGILIYKDGKSWGGASIWRFDPRRSLQRPGGTVAYSSNLMVKGRAVITAVVDHTGMTPEQNEGNNKESKRLICRLPAAKTKPPASSALAPRASAESPVRHPPVVRRPQPRRDGMLAAPRGIPAIQPQGREEPADQGGGQTPGAPAGVIVTDKLTYTGGEPGAAPEQPGTPSPGDQQPAEPFVPKTVTTDKLEYTGG